MKEQIINEILEVEGGHVNDPSDSGGETNFGITVAVARENGYTGSMASMTREIAFSIYATRYWDSVNADEILRLSEVVAEEVVDTAVNMGPSRAGKFLQRALNVLNSQTRLYADLTVDGDIGPATLSTLAAYVDVRNDLVLSKALNCLQGSFYIELAEKREKDERFVYGWLKNRVVI